MIRTTDDWQKLLAAQKHDSGYLKRDWSSHPLGVCGGEFALPTIPIKDVPDIVRDRAERGICNLKLRKRFGIKSLDQGQTLTCWAQSVVGTLSYLRVREDGTHELMSPASVAGPITGFRDQGGYVQDAIERVRKYGVNFAIDWAPNAVTDRSLYTEENQGKALANRVTEWVDFPVQGVSPQEKLDNLIAALLNGMTVATAYPFMRHAMTAEDVTEYKGQTVIVYGNSGFGRNQHGQTVLTLQQAGSYSEACAPASLMPSSDK